MVPLERLTTLFLDAGNTLVSVDFDWIAREIEERGHACPPAELRRAEAAARPHLNDWLGGGASTEGHSTFAVYLGMVIERVPSLGELDQEARLDLGEGLRPVLSQPGASDRLWKSVMPGVPEALARFRTLGLELVVVSNSDGSVARGLENVGLARHFDHVIDSAVVGFEKPDRRIFEAALERSGSHPERTLHVGDLVYADVAGARSAGVHAALLDPFGDWNEPGCAVFADLTALADALEAARG